MPNRCQLCEDELTGTHNFKPCQCDQYYHIDCFHHQIRYNDSDGISAIQCQTCQTYFRRDFISPRHQHIYQLFRTISQKFFWLYGGAQAVGGVATLVLWEPNHLVDSLAITSVIYNALLWTAILLTSTYLERPSTYKILAWWMPSLLLMVALLIYPKTWLDWVSMVVSGVLLTRTRREIFILSSEFHYQRVVSQNTADSFQMEELGSDNEPTDNPIVVDVSEPSSPEVSPSVNSTVFGDFISNTNNRSTTENGNHPPRSDDVDNDKIVDNLDNGGNWDYADNGNNGDNINNIANEDNAGNIANEDNVGNRRNTDNSDNSDNRGTGDNEGKCSNNVNNDGFDNEGNNEMIDDSNISKHDTTNCTREEISLDPTQLVDLGSGGHF